MDNLTAARKGEFTGWHMLAVMVSFFGVVIGVNIWLAVSSARTWTGLVVPNSYVASQEFNTKLEIARARTALGWRGGLAYQHGQVLFHLVDGAGMPLELERVRVEINRPVGIKGDVTLDLARRPDGSYVAPLELAPGVWNAAILATVTDEPDYEHRARLVVTSGDKQ